MRNVKLVIVLAVSFTLNFPFGSYAAVPVTNDTLRDFRIERNSSTPYQSKLINGIVDVYITKNGEEVRSSTDFTNQPISMSASSGINYPVANAFDQNLNTFWQSSAFVPSDQYITRDFGGIKRITAVAITSDGGYNGIKDFKIQGANNSDGPWVDLKVVVGETWSGIQTKTYSITDTSGYRYLRIRVSKVAFPNGPDFAIIYEVQPTVQDIAVTTSSQHAQYPVTNAFDNNTGTLWSTDAVLPPDQWLQYDFGVGGEKVVTKFKITSGNGYNAIVDFELKGSNDGSSWTPLKSVVGESWNLTMETKSYTFSNSTAFRFYRLLIHRVFFPYGSDLAQLYEIELMSSSPNDVPTIISDVFAANPQAYQAKIVILEEDINPVTPGTDIKAYVGRNGVWSSAINLIDEGTYENGKRVLSGTIALPSSGSNLQYKIEKLNNKAMRIHGVGMYWE